MAKTSYMSITVLLRVRSRINHFPYLYSYLQTKSKKKVYMYRLYNEDEGLSNIHDRGRSPRTCIFDDPNPNCITGLYQNAEAFPFPIGSSRTAQCN